MISNFKILLSLVILIFSTSICAKDIKDDLMKNKSLFSDALYSTVSSKANKKSIAKVENALVRDALEQMSAGTYSFEYRVQNYKNYLHPEILAKELKTSPYSQFENPTGIFFVKGHPAAIIVDSHKDTISIRIRDFGSEGGDSTYKLQTGINIITPENSGNGYIQYFSGSRKSLKGNVKIHIIGGEVNGYFDLSRHDNKDWKTLIGSTSSDIIDILGERVQLAYNKDSLRKYCPEDGVALASIYDSIITIQHDIMGLNKYNRAPENHIFGRVIWKGFMHADGTGAAFTYKVMKNMANPERVRANPWGTAHEFGHVNQVRPWMKWVGTTEVSNNIYSVWTQYLFNSEHPKLEREILKDYDAPVAGGRITAYMESAFINKQQWLTQAGPDRWKRQNPRDWGGDHFVKLVPLWQLQLYYAVAGKGNSWYQPDFYADIYIKAIDNEAQLVNQSDAQLNFIRTACDVTQTDLTDFFTYSGMLFPIDLWVDDYTCAQMTITEEDIVNVKKYASKYKKPASPVMHYLTANSVDYYSNKLPVVGELNTGVDKGENKLIIDHSIWQNVVAFETYKADEIIKIAFAGAGSNDNKTTLVRFPEGATRVEAVAWDGTRQIAYNL